MYPKYTASETVDTFVVCTRKYGEKTLKLGYFSKIAEITTLAAQTVQIAESCTNKSL